MKFRKTLSPTALGLSVASFGLILTASMVTYYRLLGALANRRIVPIPDTVNAFAISHGILSGEYLPFRDFGYEYPAFLHFANAYLTYIFGNNILSATPAIILIDSFCVPFLSLLLARKLTRSWYAAIAAGIVTAALSYFSYIRGSAFLISCLIAVTGSFKPRYFAFRAGLAVALCLAFSQEFAFYIGWASGLLLILLTIGEQSESWKWLKELCACAGILAGSIAIFSLPQIIYLVINGGFLLALKWLFVIAVRQINELMLLPFCFGCQWGLRYDFSGEILVVGIFVPLLAFLLSASAPHRAEINLPAALLSLVASTAISTGIGRSDAGHLGMSELLCPALLSYICFAPRPRSLNPFAALAIAGIGAVQTIILIHSVALHSLQLAIPILLALTAPVAILDRGVGSGIPNFLVVGPARLAAVLIAAIALRPYVELATRTPLLSPMSFVNGWKAHADATALWTVSPDASVRNRLLATIEAPDIHSLVVLTVPTNLYVFSHKKNPTEFLHYPLWHDRGMVQSVIDAIVSSSPLVVVNNQASIEIWPNLLLWVEVNEKKIDRIGPYDIYSGRLQAPPDRFILTSVPALFSPETSAGEWIWRNYFKPDPDDQTAAYMFQHPPYGTCGIFRWPTYMPADRIFRVSWKRRKGYEQDGGRVTLTRVRDGNSSTLFSSEFGNRDRMSFEIPPHAYQEGDTLRFCTELAHGSSFRLESLRENPAVGAAK